jgi:hypothetical protein
VSHCVTRHPATRLGLIPTLVAWCRTTRHNTKIMFCVNTPLRSIFINLGWCCTVSRDTYVNRTNSNCVIRHRTKSYDNVQPYE